MCFLDFRCVFPKIFRRFPRASRRVSEGFPKGSREFPRDFRGRVGFFRSQGVQNRSLPVFWGTSEFFPSGLRGISEGGSDSSGSGEFKTGHFRFLRDFRFLPERFPRVSEGFPRNFREIFGHFRFWGVDCRSLPVGWRHGHVGWILLCDWLLPRWASITTYMKYLPIIEPT